MAAAILEMKRARHWNCPAPGRSGNKYLILNILKR